MSTPHPSHEPEPTEDAEPIVVIVEDDPLVRGSMESLLRSAGRRSIAFPSAHELLDATLPDTACCLILDVRLPRLSGLDLQAELVRRGENVPIIFVTGHGDIQMSVKAMKAGAVDFLVKPFRDQDMLDAVTAALDQDRARRREDAGRDLLRARFDRLTPREKEIMGFVSAGLLNKQIAAELSLSEITVKLHRASLMRKMQAGTLANLVRMAEALERAARPT